MPRVKGYKKYKVSSLVFVNKGGLWKWAASKRSSPSLVVCKQMTQSQVVRMSLKLDGLIIPSGQ